MRLILICSIIFVLQPYRSDARYNTDPFGNWMEISQGYLLTGKCESIDYTASLFFADSSYSVVAEQADKITGENFENLIGKMHQSQIFDASAFAFNLLVSLQWHLKFLYNSMPPVERINYMIRHTTLNNDLSELKTYILMSTLNYYSVKNDSAWWQYPLFMIERVSLDSDVFNDKKKRREPDGITVHPSEIIKSLYECARFRKGSDKEFGDFLEEKIKTAGSYNPTFREKEIIVSLDQFGGGKPESDKSELYEIYNKAFISSFPSEAIILYSRCLKIDSLFVPALINRGIMYYNQQNFEEAKKDLDKAFSLEKNPVAVVYLGLVCMKELRYKDAVQYFNAAARLDGKMPEIYVNRGICHQRMGNYSEAAADYSKVIDSDAENVTALINRAICFSELNRASEAESDYKKILKIDHNNAKTLYNLGCLYWKTKNWKGVINNWKKYIQLTGSDKNLEKKINYAINRYRKSVDK